MATLEAPATAASSDFLSLVPDGWLRTYLDAMAASRNEMPLPFHFLAGAVVVGQMLGLRTWATINKGVRIFPNINGLLLSPAGSCRRGEGTKITEKIARAAGLNLLSGKTTPEGLVDEIQEHGNVLLYVEELAMLLTKQDFQRPIIPVLTKLLLHGDGPCEMRTRQMGEKRSIPWVNLSALFTSAADWFMTTIPEEAFGGGMMSRFLVCCINKRDVFEIDIQADDVVAESVIQDLAKSLIPCGNVLSGHVRGTDDAQAWIKKWYVENEERELEDDRIGPHRNRKPANLLRLALILAASAQEEVLTKPRLEQALEILNWFEPTMYLLYGISPEGKVPVGKGELRVLRLLAKAGGEQFHGELSRRSSAYFPGHRTIRQAFEAMYEKGLMEPRYKNGITKWPPASWKLLVQPDETAEVTGGG